MDYQPTAEEYREQFNRSGLWRIGWTFEQAMQSEAHVKTLTSAIKARRIAAQQAANAPRPEFCLT